MRTRKLLSVFAVCAAALIPAAALAAPATKYHNGSVSGSATRIVNCTVFWHSEFDHSGQAGQKPPPHASDRITRNPVCSDGKSSKFGAHDEITCAYTGRLFFYEKRNGNAIVTVRGQVSQVRCPVILPLAETAWIVQQGFWIHFTNGWKYSQDYCVTKVPDTKITRKCGP